MTQHSAGPYRRRTALVLLLALAGLSACSDKTDSGTGPTVARAYQQVQRLGNPLVSEVLLSKRSHATHATIGPAQDAALIGAEAESFITDVAGRSQTYADAIGGALIPDMLVVQTDKDPATAGWLTWLPIAPFTNGYGGRKLDDDVTDLALLAVFGDPFGLEPGTASPSLTSDNVGSDSPFQTAFPYLADPN